MAARVALFSLTLTLLIVNSFATYTLQAADQPLQFTYSGATGPEKWGSLNPKFSLCATGESQSPINIVEDQAVVNKNLKPLLRAYHPVNGTLTDVRFTVVVEYPEDSGWMIVDGKKYALKQMHWHSPSEHRINGKRFAAELHMVHVSEDGRVAVLGYLFKYGHPDPILGQIHKKLNELAYEESAQLKLVPFHPAVLKENPRKYYKYIGSFSAPPCTENVIYIIVGKVRSISRDQVQALKAPLDIQCKNNARPYQPLNGRHVELYDKK
ncbi:alpha carbonic anhydrase 1, chloroplastic-like [Primulina huaijiensis]|uniref:alpha carbonic anhydrase 1, chloroplastic-like n=1 Tax=Primulina huaijiensis TaxID=1492673 RepID=UPI003CC71529